MDIVRSIIDMAFMAYTVLLMIRILGSWFPNFRESRVMKFVSFYTDPYLRLFKKIIPPLGMIDISPIVAFFALRFMQWFLVAKLLG